MAVDYDMPLELRCLMVTQIAQGDAGIRTVLVKSRARIMWKDIVYIEEFVLKNTIPPHEFGELTYICTNRVTYLCVFPFNRVADDWDSYKAWVNKNTPKFNMNAN